MNTRLLLGTAALAASLVPIAAAAQATAGSGSRTDCLAQLVPARLPHTPDAVEGWYRSCERTPRLGTPDANEGWLR